MFMQFLPYWIVFRGTNMSVQAGIWNLNGEPVDCQLLTDFNEAIKPHGPDGEFRWVGNSIAMLYRPFHTTCESHSDKQPCVSRGGFVLTWDGRLDNRDDLVSLLPADVGASQSDSSVVAAAFDHWLTDAPQRLIGDWAVSVWNPAEQELILAVDFMAMRHIFYQLSADHVWWSTDLDPLIRLCHGQLHVNGEFVAGYLTGECDGHTTPYKEICEVAPGHSVRISKRKLAVNRYWSPYPKSRIHYESDTEYEQHFRQVLRQAVRRRLRSNRPILAELSGGLDSSSIVCMADDLVSRGEDAVTIDTLSCHDTTEPSGDDRYFFGLVEQKRGRKGHHIDSSKLGTASGLCYQSSPGAFPGHLDWSRETEHERAAIISSGGYRVVLSGIGGDELLGGVPNPAPRLADLIVQFRIATLAREIGEWSAVKRRPWIHLLFSAFMELTPVWVLRSLQSKETVEPWINEDFARRHNIFARLIEVDDEPGFKLPSHRALANTIISISRNMAKRTATSMVSEEIRYPYLDQTLVEFVASIPSTQLLRPGERRSLMRRALAGIVPREILARRTKQVGARTPLLAVANNWDELQNLFKDPVSSEMGYIDRVRLHRSLDAAKAGKAVHLHHLFKAISLEVWLRDLMSRDVIVDDRVHGGLRPLPH
jgi:asparagine synthase (glutamine-hydrolysing)